MAPDAERGTEGPALSRTAIILAYHFPPVGGVAVTRVMRFVRYLGEFGWTPVVITIDRVPPGEFSDPDLLQELPPALEVHRVPCLEPDLFSNAWSRPGQKVVRNLFKTLDFLLVPDDRAFWVKPAARAAARIAKMKKASIIFATAQPFSTLLAGVEAAKRAGVALVSDFRDDWTTSNATFRRYHPARQRREEKQELQVLQYSAAVLSVTKGIVRSLTVRSPHPERVHLLTNGYDPAHFQKELEPRTDDNFRLLHAGGIYAKRSPQALLAGFAKARKRHPRLQLRFLGRVDRDSYHFFDPAPEGVQRGGFRPHQQVIDEMRHADVNVLLLEQVDKAPWLVTGKVFEYFAARKPILMIGPGDIPLADMVRESGLGRVCPNEPDRIAETIEAMMDWTPAPNEEYLAQFNAREQTAKLARIFNEVAWCESS